MTHITLTIRAPAPPHHVQKIRVWLFGLYCLLCALSGFGLRRKIHPPQVCSPWGGLLALYGWYSTRDKREERKRREQEAAEAAEQQRIAHRDADTQTTPYRYRCIGHPNVTLAIRYGIANMKKEIKEYWYYGKGGEQIRSPDRDKIVYLPADSILVQKIKRIHEDRFLAELPDFGNRTVVVVIENGSESVKTFYPLDESWFARHSDLEQTLKDNKTFTLKELAKFHVEKTIRGA